MTERILIIKSCKECCHCNCYNLYCEKAKRDLYEIIGEPPDEYGKIPEWCPLEKKENAKK